MTLTVGSLFSGIGGIDLGLERAGMEVRWQAETDPYASKVLAKHWPDVPNLGDVTTIDWENDGLDHGDGIARSLDVDVVAGGFPCQPVSTAGRGLAQLDSRWLWPEFGRAIRLLRPRYVLVENVPGLLIRGMGDVLGDLAALGYDAEWTGIPATAVGAPHLRWRIFVVAYPSSGGRGWRGAGPRTTTIGEPPDLSTGPSEDLAYADAQRGELSARPQQGGQPHLDRRCFGDRRPDRRASGGWWDVEPDMGRVAHGVSARVDRLRCLGNAVVPQVAEYVGRRILDAHRRAA